MSAKLLLIISIIWISKLNGSTSAPHSPTSKSVSSNAEPDKDVITTVVFAGDDLRVRCSGNTRNTSLDKLAIEHIEYSWTYHGRPIMSGAKVDKKNGDLAIQNLRSSQSGNYDCWASGQDLKSRNVGMQFYHHIIGFVLPEVVLSISYIYKVPKCVQYMDDDVITLYKTRLCSGFRAPCPFTVIYECKHPERSRQAMLNDHDFNITVLIRPAQEYQPPICALDCIRNSLASHLFQLKVKTKVDWVDLLSQADPKSLMWYRYFPIEGEEDLIESCPPGFINFESTVCFPCEPGQFWSEHTSKCQDCPRHMYQDRAAAVSCFPCPDKHRTEKVGANNADKCVPSRVTEGPTLLGWPPKHIHDYPEMEAKYELEQRRGSSVNRSHKRKYLWVCVGIIILCGMAFTFITIYIAVMKCRERSNNNMLASRLSDAERYERLEDADFEEDDGYEDNDDQPLLDEEAMTENGSEGSIENGSGTGICSRIYGCFKKC